jgi:hypothetical protein
MSDNKIVKLRPEFNYLGYSVSNTGGSREMELVLQQNKGN